MKRFISVLAVISMSLLFLSGCGGSDTTAKLQQKTATVTFSTVSSAHTAPLKVIQLSATLPAGASIADINTAVVGRNNAMLFGSPQYTAATRTISFMVTSTESLQFGTFAELKCDVASGVTLYQSSFESINTPFTDLVLNSGGVNGNSVDLKSEIPVKLSVVFGY